MTEGEATWGLNTLIGLPLLLLLAAAFFVASVWLKRWRARNPESYEYGAALWLARASIGAGVAVLFFTAVGFYPWKSEYHQYVAKVGTVELISKRIVGGSDSINEKFVARYTDGREFGCLDTRCANVRVGDTLILACKRTWQYAGTDGYDCNFVESRRPS